MKLLIADDDLMSRTTLSSMAEQWGYEPICAEDGEAAWDILQESAQPLLLLDWEMPRLNGLDLCARIKETFTKENRPYIIMLTANGRVDDLVAGLEVGANDYITKPYEIMELQARINVGKRMVRLQSELLAAHKRLEMLASIDDLTGVYNRRSFNQRIEKEWAHALRNSEQLCVAFIDVDHFKKFNDTYGHLSGDKCLRAVAREIAGTLKRSTDVVARYGGEEFVLILPLTTNLETALEACRAAVERLEIEHRGSDSGTVTVSIGGAAITPRAESGGLNELLAKADVELYKAKDQGRNRICTINLD